MSNISIIVAIAENNAIGINNNLLCHLPEDLKRFKQITSGHKIIMGKITYFTLPKRPLPNRTNVVLTNIQGEIIEGCQMAYSIDDVLKICNEEESFIIGGGSVYRQFLPIANKLYLTKIHHKFEADTYFSDINFDEWETISESDIFTDEKSGIAYSFVDYKRK
ncbi:MAG: hypothetical protein A2033_15535 [Bacteroidetes bacterium GWA2_31_9]|nr:MAG: hypothetical protein A2033_15535 [Bacteroidetes bacterium GWA2_31_9]